MFTYIWAILLLFGKFCGVMSWNCRKFFYVVVLKKLSLHINSQPLGCNPTPAIPTGRIEKHFLGFFLKVSFKNYGNTLASNTYFFQLLERNTVRPNSGRTKEFDKNRNLKLDTFSDRDLKVFWRPLKWQSLSCIWIRIVLTIHFLRKLRFFKFL